MSNVAETLRSGGKRERVHDAQAVFKLPKRAKALVNEIAEKQGGSDADIYRDALAEYLERRGYRL